MTLPNVNLAATASERTPGPDEPAGREDYPGAQASFDGWIASLPPARALNPRTITGYKLIWTSWLRFLAGRRRQWHEATAEDFGTFIDTLAGASNWRQRASHVTANRYWRVIGEIYERALHDGELERNPACAANRPSRPEAEKSVAISPHFLAELRKRLPEGDDLKTLRDRAMLAVLADVGPTTRELIELAPADVLRSTVRDCYVVRFTGKREPQNRELYLSEAASLALHRWLQERNAIETPTDRVFVSMRGSRALEPTDVLKIVSTWLRATLPQVGLQVVDHMGSNCLRTAVLIWWRDKDKLPVDELLARAGLAEPQALRRLPIENRTPSHAATAPHPAATKAVAKRIAKEKGASTAAVAAPAAVDSSGTSAV